MTTLTQFGGTIQYCSPEHFRGRVSARSDIYSLGVTLYEMLTGVMPIGTSYIFALQRDMPLPAPPSVRSFYPDQAALIDRVIERALKKEASERHKSAAELFAEFKSILRRFEESSVDGLSQHILELLYNYFETNGFQSEDYSSHNSSQIEGSLEELVEAGLVIFHVFNDHGSWEYRLSQVGFDILKRVYGKEISQSHRLFPLVASQKL